ncbi:MAG: ribosome biogenesis GTP-binding protein YihA/YsxC [Oscillospiraceae bacterium]
MNFNNVKFETSFGVSAQLPKSDKIEIAFSGRSNVGKSTLINKTFNRKQLARVSSMPGKTVTINFFSLENVRFVDLPGYGYAKVAKSEKQRWAELMEHYFSTERNIQLVFQLIDMRHPPSNDDIIMVNFLIDHEFPFVIILTKKDKLSKKQQAERLAAFKHELPCGEDLEMIPFSSQTGDGVDIVREIIEEIAAAEQSEEDDEQEDSDEEVAEDKAEANLPE